MEETGKKPIDFRKKLTPEDEEKIFVWASEGVRITEIANRLQGKVTKQRIDQLLKKKGINPAKLLKEQTAKEWTDKMSLKWGQSYHDPEKRKDTVYQLMRQKFRTKKANNYEHEWTVEFGELDFPEHCPILGIKLDYFTEKRNDNSVSFDRIDNTKGYIKGNVLICSWRANRIKNDGTADEHKKIYEFLVKSIDNS